MHVMAAAAVVAGERHDFPENDEEEAAVVVVVDHMHEDGDGACEDEQHDFVHVHYSCTSH